MDVIELVLPDKAHENEALAYRQEHFDYGELVLHGSSLFDKAESYDHWLAMIRSTKRPNWVNSSAFFAERKNDGRIVGMVDIRHTLNEMLEKIGGHIGYGVRPSERQKGYATQMLQKALTYCKGLGLNKVLLVCDKSNAASRGTIVKCGGILQDEVIHPDGSTLQRYWISIGE